jgi:hypothetical protein
MRGSVTPISPLSTGWIVINNSTGLEAGLNGLMAGMASLWSPDASDETFAVLATAVGGAAGLRAAGAPESRLEFSHSLPARWFRPLTVKAGRVNPEYKPLLDNAYGWANDTVLNGNYRTPMQHYLEDGFRYPRGWQSFGPRLPSALQKFSRIPNVFKGLMAGGVLGAAAVSDAFGGSSNCGCPQ